MSTLSRPAGRAGTVPSGPPAESVGLAVGLAVVGALEGTTIALAGQVPVDELFASRAVAGVLGLSTPPAPSPEE